MLFKFLKELKESLTKEEFIEVLQITEQDIKFNQLGFNKLTKAKKFIEICKSSLILVKEVKNFETYQD